MDEALVCLARLVADVVDEVLASLKVVCRSNLRGVDESELDGGVGGTPVTDKEAAKGDRRGGEGGRWAAAGGGQRGQGAGGDVGQQRRVQVRKRGRGEGCSEACA